MEISEFNGVPVVPGDQPGALGSTGLAETFDNFLQLLTTQLQNQDPLEPLDPNEFTQQLVQFSGVEQSIATNSKLDELIALQGGSQLGAAVSYIGKEVKADSDQIALQGGSATLFYGIEGAATQASITIMDEAGLPVRTLAGSTAPGIHELTWDGTDAQGNLQPDGTYQILVTALDNDGQPVSTARGLRGRVTGIEAQDGQVFLNIGSLLLPLDQVFAVNETPGATAGI